MKFQLFYTLSFDETQRPLEQLLLVTCELVKYQVDKQWDVWGDWTEKGRVITVEDSPKTFDVSWAARTMLTMFKRMHS